MKYTFPSLFFRGKQWLEEGSRDFTANGIRIKYQYPQCINRSPTLRSMLTTLDWAWSTGWMVATEACLKQGLYYIVFFKIHSLSFECTRQFLFVSNPRPLVLHLLDKLKCRNCIYILISLHCHLNMPLRKMSLKYIV